MHTTPRMYTACVIYVYIYSYTLRMSIYLPFGNQTWQSNMLFETVYINGVSQFNPIAPPKKEHQKTLLIINLIPKRIKHQQKPIMNLSTLKSP